MHRLTLRVAYNGCKSLVKARTRYHLGLDRFVPYPNSLPATSRVLGYLEQCDAGWCLHLERADTEIFNTSSTKALFASGIIIFVEKLFLQFVAINFHEKALAERIAENQLGLKALDHLSDAPITQTKKAGLRKGMKSPTPLDYSNAGPLKAASLMTESFPVKEEDNGNVKSDQSSSPNPFSLHKRKKKNVTSVIVDQVGLTCLPFRLNLG